MIRVGVNARVLGKPDPAGVSRYTSNLLGALAELEPAGFEFLLFGIKSLPDRLRGYDHLRNTAVSPPVHSGLRAHYWEQLTLPCALRRFDLDVFHTPAGQPPILAGLSDVGLVTTIHDLSPVRHPEWFSHEYSAVYRVLTPLAVHVSTRIIAVSEFTRGEVIDAYPSAVAKTITIHNGVISPVDPGTPVESLVGRRFLLFVGGANRRKNLETLVSAYRRYRARAEDPIALALAGPEREVFAAVEYDSPRGVDALGYVSDDELGWLYRNATAFVFPALYEGFGLPIVEAMHVGTPVITSNRGSMAEVADEAAHLIDPLDPPQLAAAIDRVVSANEYRARLADHGRERAMSFTWARAAEQTLQVYRTATKR